MSYPMSFEKYKDVSHKRQCPFCGSEDIKHLGYMTQARIFAYQDNKCNSCKKEWNDRFKLVSYEDNLE